MMPAIAFNKVSKSYPLARGLSDWIRQPLAARREYALNEVTFQFHSGQVIGVIGHNGAGKTTLLKMLCDLLAPDAGEALVLGCRLPYHGRRLRARIGYVPSDERSFFWRLSGRANLEFFAGLYDVPSRVTRQRIEYLLDTFGLTGKAGGHFRDYSSGMRKRLAIIRALLHEPQMLVMDEPTNSLDPHWSQFLGEYIRQWAHRDANRLVIWSTHRLEEIPNVCDRTLHLKAGKVQFCGASQAAVCL